MLLFYVGLYGQTLQFTRQTYTDTINETSNSPFNLVPRPPDGFLAVQCTGGSNISYDITSSDLLPFAINSWTGELRVTSDLDYDTHELPHTFSVVCYENATQTINDTAEVVIEVLPVNEYRPEVLDSSMTTFIFIDETLAIGTVIVANSEDAPPDAVTKYTVHDRDAGIDGTITYTFAPSAITGDFFSLDLAKGFVTIVRELDLDSDMEPAPQFLHPTITACDFFPPILTCPNIDVNIFIQQINEFLPEFSQDRYTVAVPRTVTEAYTILQATCTDQDKGIGAFQGIAFADGASVSVTEIFNLNTVSGEIGVPAMTFTAAVSFLFTLHCYDNGGLEDFADVTITIDDPTLNEYTPEFSQETYSMTVSENTVSGYTVFQASCVDHDQGVGEFVSIEYVDSTLVSGDELHLNSTTGDITVVNVDYEPVQRYQFTLQCSDSEGLTDRADVTIIVTDVNDNAPQCDNTSVTSTLSVGAYSNPVILFTLSCIDLDSGANAKLSYAISRISPSNDAIGIYLTTGDISFRGTLAETGTQTYTITFTVTDSGDPPMSQVVDISLRLAVTPSCLEDSLEAQLSAGRHDSVGLLTLSCQGHDNLSYSVIDGPSVSGSFEVDSSMGELRFTGEIEEGAYEVIVRVTDPSGLYSDFSVTIDVGPETTTSDDEIPIYTIVIPIAIILILFTVLNVVIIVIVVMVIRRRREKAVQ